MGKYLLGARLALTNAFGTVNHPPVKITRLQVGRTSVQFIGVVHDYETFRTNKKLFVESIRNANLVVVEADRSILKEIAKDNADTVQEIKSKCLIRTIVKGRLEHNREFYKFYSAIDTQAKHFDRPVYCFEPDKCAEKVSQFRLFGRKFGVIKTLADGYSRLSSLALSLALYENFTSLLSGDLSLRRIVGCVVGTILSMAFVAALVDKSADLKRRNVSVASGLADLIKEKSPGVISVIYGGAHVDDFVTYLTNQDLLARHVKDV